ncbi:cytochrome P450 monooxygenase pc-bph [Desarmillaria tabescens]|uniref:Cytochrome P450 monooxygenase pc-bph n=1 Tax=Armillaria tabescens TaxID=1929756 RepID=A0AA39NAD1_ARMTA|nr:cytochrome P450 monooxygenase pc-bph [Desarmillaria tabescens]KAK0461977.1 cytochrome P450 monooxygenase pc-bph [Desarmillaria tabescens]
MCFTCIGILSALFLIAKALFVLVALHVYAYWLDLYDLRRYPGPFLAKFSYIWLVWTGWTLRRSQILYEIHRKYGPVVRISPTELSFSCSGAFSSIYSRGSSVTKSNFYDAFATIGLPSIFSTRQKTEHSQKRKMMYHFFTPKTVAEFSPRITCAVNGLLKEWDTRFAGPSYSKNSQCVWFDCLPWCAFLSFDSIGDFIFGESFGMVAASQDTVSIPKDPRLTLEHEIPNETMEVSLMEIAGSRETYNYFVGILPSWWKPMGHAVLRGPVKNGLLVARTVAYLLSQRLSLVTQGDAMDLVGRFLQRQKHQTFEQEPLIVEVLTMLVAGSDTTRNSIAAAIYYISRSPEIQAKLRAELDAHIPGNHSVSFEDVQQLPYLDACINETLRMYSAVPGSLPRVVPEGGMSISGHDIVAGATVGVHIYSLHHDPTVWGHDADTFSPDRWLEIDTEVMRRAFKPFSDGPAACIGKTLAMVQLHIALASVFKRFEIIPEDPDDALLVDDWFVRRIKGCRIGIHRRNTT